MKTQQMFSPGKDWSAYERQRVEKVKQWLAAGESGDGLQQASDHAVMLEQLGADHDVIVAGMLGEGLEPESHSLEQLQAEFGPEVAKLYQEARRFIDDPTGWLEQSADQQDKDDGHQLLLLAMLQDIRVVFVLLAHQVLLMRRLKDRPTAEQRRIASQTRALFAPLANRLGIAQIKWELEDLAFRYLEPDRYREIAYALEERRVDRESYIEQVVTQLRSSLEAVGVDAEVYGRPKHIYSIWRKMQLKQLNFDQLYDVRALRVMVDDVASCYSALAVVHSMWTFIPGEYDDYVAAPKPNGYQSLHTAVIGPQEKTLEIQIRTGEMHEHAELGIAAHWRYKEGGKRDVSLENRIETLRALIRGEAETTAENGAAVMSQAGDIYALTPQGRVIELPAGATPLDFAYRVHTDIGHRCRGAKVDGRIVPLTTPLKSGQQVEVLTGKQARPSRDWMIPHLGYLKTRRARAKIRHWFKQEYRDQHVTAGRAALAREFSKAQLAEADLEALARHFNLTDSEDLYAAIGRGEIGLHAFANALNEASQAQQPEALSVSGKKTTLSQPSGGRLQLQGMDDLLSSLARCCKPMPGDEIIGYITQGRGVSIHRRDCSNVGHLIKRHPQRVIEVDWSAGQASSYSVDVEIEAVDRAGLLRDVSSVLAGEDVNVLAANTHSNKQHHIARMRLSLEVRDGRQLKQVLARLLQIQNVFEAQRVK